MSKTETNKENISTEKKVKKKEKSVQIPTKVTKIKLFLVYYIFFLYLKTVTFFVQLLIKVFFEKFVCVHCRF